MSADPSSEKKPSALRPLPSVDMALLPDQLRARRTRRLVVGALVGAVVVGGLLFWIAKSVIPQSWSWMEDTLGRQDAKLAADLALIEGPPLPDEDGGVESSLSEEERVALSRSRPNARYETLFGTVPSFRGALLEAGLEAEELGGGVRVGQGGPRFDGLVLTRRGEAPQVTIADDAGELTAANHRKVPHIELVQ